jgi:predicted nucleic acid-binding protein
MLRDSTTRRILQWPFHTFLAPEYAYREVESHLDELAPRMRMSRSDAELLLHLIASRVQTVPEAEIRPYMEEANTIMRDLDPDDAPFVATALAVPNDGIWSHDKALHRQTRVPVRTTTELVKAIENETARRLGETGGTPPS